MLYLSLANLSPPQIPGKLGDKYNHLIAYAFLMLWFGQLYQHSRAWFRIAILLILFGSLMELLQGVLPHRWFDFNDALANTMGVIFGVLVLFVGGDGVLNTLAHWIRSTRGR